MWEDTGPGQRVSGRWRSVAPSMTAPVEGGGAPASTEVRQRRRTSGTISVASYNVRDGRRGGLYSAVRALRRGRVDVAILQETKIAKAKFAPRSYKGYTTRVAPSSGKNCGGVGLVYKETSRFSVENAKVVGPNVVSFHLVTHEKERWYVVGCYFPPLTKRGRRGASPWPSLIVLPREPVLY